MSVRQLAGPASPAPRGAGRPAEPEVVAAPRVARRPLTVMERLERRSQPYIVAVMAVVAVVRGFYLFTDKLINLAKYPAINYPVSVVTGVCLSVASELTVTIAGRRMKGYRAQLYAAEAELAALGPKNRQRGVWEVEVRRLKEQVAANLWAMRVSMVMSGVAAGSYLLDSTNASTRAAEVVVAVLAGYVLYLMYYHGVQTDEIRDDPNEAANAEVEETMAAARVETAQALRADMAGADVSPLFRLALLTTGMRPAMVRSVLPVLRLFYLGAAAVEPAEDPTADYWPLRTVAVLAGEDFEGGRKADDILRKYRMRAARLAPRHPGRIVAAPDGSGWRVEPELARQLWALPDEAVSALLGTPDGAPAVVVDAAPAG